jgi:GNAT superfamily N-acetyltransferase
MLSIIKTNANNPQFVQLVQQLDAELAIRDGADHAYYHQFNSIEDLDYVIVALEDKIPVGCGAIKPFNNKAMEVKRMFVVLNHRGKGFAQRILTELEQWAIQLSYKKCVLETGKKQPEAIALYQKCGYTQIENYGQYAGIENSLCFEKTIN